MKEDAILQLENPSGDRISWMKTKLKDFSLCITKRTFPCASWAESSMFQEQLCGESVTGTLAGRWHEFSGNSEFLRGPLKGSRVEKRPGGAVEKGPVGAFYGEIQNRGAHANACGKTLSQLASGHDALLLGGALSFLYFFKQRRTEYMHG